MELNIKQLSGSLTESQKQYLRKKMLWLRDHLGNSSNLTVGVKEKVTKKSNQAYEIVLHLTAPKLKRPAYVRVRGNNFRESVDRAKDKIERIVVKRKERTIFKFKLPRLRKRQ